MNNFARIVLAAVLLIGGLLIVLRWQSPEVFSALLERAWSVGSGGASSGAEPQEPPAPSIVDAASSAFSSELNKSDASRLLFYMGCTGSSVAAVVNGLGVGGLALSSSSNVAMVLATCRRQDGSVEVDQYTFMRDPQLGWFYSEMDKKRGRIRLWTVNGYQEVSVPPHNAPAENGAPPMIGPDGLPVAPH